MRGLFLACVVSCVLFQGATSCVVTDYSRVSIALKICETIILDNVYIPGGETLRLHLRDGAKLYFRGNTTFGHYAWSGPLVEITGTNVIIEGEENSILDGQGPLYWDKHGEWGVLKPKFFTIQLHNSSMNNIHVLNNPIQCVNLFNSSNVQLARWVIDASSGDPEVVGVDNAGNNTDGFTIWNSTDVVLLDGVVHNQGDCVALRSGCNILVDNMICYGGRGLTISVGFSDNIFAYNLLQNITIKNSILERGENGINIKTRVDGVIGLLRNITFENINFEGPTNYGINIEENYMDLSPNSTLSSNAKTNTLILDLKLINIIGSVELTAVPIHILCVEDGCSEWTFTNVLVTGEKSNECNFEPEGFKCT
ncbi:uncharacterized protein [Euwallacea fornicatus]|uniref:uncharacterized protein isoform X2 n=1 Tax=Euwallacea fornicatus TaxID=995702 RepID=UPI00338E32A9